MTQNEKISRKMHFKVKKKLESFNMNFSQHFQSSARKIDGLIAVSAYSFKLKLLLIVLTISSSYSPFLNHYQINLIKWFTNVIIIYESRHMEAWKAFKKREVWSSRKKNLEINVVFYNLIFFNFLRNHRSKSKIKQFN